VTALWRDGRARFGGLVLALALLGALAAPLVTPPEIDSPDVVRTRFLPPLATGPDGTWHALGTDRLGRDVWTRLVYGARVSLMVGVAAVAISVVLGLAVGAVAGFWPGRPALVLLGLTDFALAVPRVVLLLLLAALWRPSAALVVVVLGLTGWMPIARLVHGEVRALAARPFVEGAVAAGAGAWRVLARHIVPNALTPVIVAAALGVGNAMLLEAGLSFLGLGVQPPYATWGNILNDGKDSIEIAWWMTLYPGLAILVTVLSYNLLGEGVRDALDPRLRQSRGRARTGR
jgi:peptide/nickel transport system permease protein